MWRWDGDGCVWQRVSHTAYPEHIETDRIFRYEPYDPDIDMKMNSVTVRDASANGEAFTHNVDKQKHKYKKEGGLGMGLFDKKICDICGEKIGLLGNRKLDDGNLCKDCAKNYHHGLKTGGTVR